MSKKNDDVTFRQIIAFCLLHLTTWLQNQVTRLTKYYPFSLIPNRWCLHYKNRDVVYAWDCLTNAWLKTGPYFKVNQFEKNDNFIIFEGVFPDKPPLIKINKYMKYLENKFIKGNVFLQRDIGRYLIFFNKEVVAKSMPA